MGESRSRGRRATGLLAVLALVGALLIPLAVVTATSASAGCGVGEGVAQGCDINDCENNNASGRSGDICCPDGSWGRFEWGGYAGQNAYWCDAPPYEPPATAEPTPEPTMEPTVAPTAAPKKAPAAAPAAKPTFTG